MKKEIDDFEKDTDVPHKKEENKTFTKAKKEYNVLLGTGMFWEFFPEYSGEWEKDKEMFLEFYKNRENDRKN